jgi:Rap1a immunity proteins
MESLRSLRPIATTRGWAHGASRRRLRASALLAALGALTISLAPLRGEAGSFSGNWWFDVCAKDYALCSGYMAAVMDLYQFTDKPSYCPPTGPGGARIGHVQAIVLKYLQEHPEKRHLPFARLTLDALERAYPCRKDSN